MGEILLTFAVEQILEKVGSIAIQEIAGPWRLKKDLDNLRQLTQSIHAKVQEARNNQAAYGQAVKPLLVKLQDVLYSAEDVLDEFSYELLRRKIADGMWLMILGFASRNNPIFFQLKMARKVKKINQSLADIEKQAIREIAFIGKAVADPFVVSNDQLDRVTVSYFDKSAPPIIGRTSEVKAITDMLQVSSSTPLLTVVSIVGFGGLGKTTLAKMVLHEVEKTKLFDETLWVCVSEPFDVKEILQGMLDTLDKTTGGLNNVDAILRHLKEKLTNKRFFLVLDDVWEHSRIKCNSLKSHLLTICNRAGNFVIVTTRSLDVAEAMDTQDEHVVPLKELEDNECWNIIREKCLMQWGGSMPEELEQIGVDVAKKCKGVPLAAKVVGGTLCKKKNREEWLSIKNSDAWEQINEENQIFPVLKLSFHQLDPSLKQCFAYCSLFPKDFQYDKEKLIQLWMAEGFLNTTSTNPSPSGKSLEAVGDECFNGLLVHSFFQDIEVDDCGNIEGCKMHDLLHDLATSLSNYKMLNLDDESRCFVRTSNHQHHPSAEELGRGGARNVRCVISKAVGHVSHMLSTFKSLRSLDISNAGLKELPSVIGRLKHLRYLDISCDYDIKELPEFITKLYNLQTLRMKGPLGSRMLPTSMVNLVRLRHIHFDDPDLKIYNVGRLTELRTLPHFEVRAEDGFGIEELKKLNELRGKLSITGLHNVRDREEAEGANLKEKKLTELELEWKEETDSNCNDENVLEGLLPPPSIKRLAIDEYKGVKFPNWMSMGINNSQCQLTELVELSLSNCQKCDKMPSLGHLPRLKILEVDGLDNIRCIGSEFYGECKREVTLFPALKKLSLVYMRSLEEWGALVAIEERIVEVFPLLEELHIRYCPRLRSIPLRHLSSLVSVTIERCDDMEYLSNDFQNLPSLDYLEITDCRSLVSLSSLQDLKSLKMLKIKRCDDMEYLSNDFQNLPSLDYLEITDCRSLVSLSSLQDLKSLKKLKIEGCVGLTSLSKGLVSLENLEIHSCGDLSSDAFCGLSSLKCLSIWKGSMESIPNVERPSSLEELRTLNCPKVKSVPHWIKFCTSLRQLHIRDCEGLLSIDDDIISSLTKLKELSLGPFSVELENFPGLNSIHHLSQLSPSIEILSLCGWEKLTSLPHQLQYLTGLQELDIWNFKGVTSINDGIFSSLTKLKELRMGPFSEELEEFPGLNSIHLLTQIETLQICGWHKLKSLPQQLQHLTALKELTIWNFEGVETLPDWLGNLSSLQQLYLYKCDNLTNLPTTMNRLSNLIVRVYDQETDPDYSEMEG